VREDDNRGALLESLDVFLEPLKLRSSERPKTAGFEIDDVDQADEVHAAHGGGRATLAVGRYVFR
jgi:hypothetical protein